MAKFVIAIRLLTLQKITQNNDICPWFINEISGFIPYPISYALPANRFQSIHEDFCTSCLMFIPLFILYLPVTGAHNALNINTIMLTSGVIFSIIEMLAGSLDWVIDIIMYHGFNGNFILKHFAGLKFGLEWTKYGYLHVLGTVTFLFGGLVYMKGIKFPCFGYLKSNVSLINKMSTFK